MSAPLFKDDILFDQRILACGGFYKGKLDGKWGAVSEKAQQEADEAYANLRNIAGTFDSRSEKNIATLHPAMQRSARVIMLHASAWAATNDLTLSIISGTRTYAEQDGLYKQRPKVTNARGGQSNHNFGIAIDIGLFKSGKYLAGTSRSDDKLYSTLGVIIKSCGAKVEWGGDWKSIVDKPHYQLATGLSLSQVRAKFEAGKLAL